MAAPSQSLTDKRQLRGRRGPVAPVVETLEDSWVDRLEDGRALRKGQLDIEGLERCYPTPPPRAAPSAAEASSTSTLPIFKSKEELEQMRRAMRENRLQQLQQRRPLREEMLATMSPPANRWDTCRQDDSQSVHTSPPDDSDDDDAVLRRIAQPARLPELIPEPKNTGGDCVGPARLVQVIQAWENPYDKHEKFLRLKLGETLKLTHPELNIDGLGLFGGKKYDGMDGPAGWFPSKCVSPIREPHVRGQDADLAGGRGLCKFEDDWDTYTDPATMQKWYHRRSTEEYFFERNPTGWKMYFTDKHQTERRWWYHEADNRYFFEKYETVG